MPAVALLAVLLAACTHATWNLFAKRAASSRLFVWMYSAGSVVLAGLTREPRRAPRAGILFGLATGACISAYTVNDGWAADRRRS